MMNETIPLIASFDIFDTVLTRAVGNPSSLFLLLGRRASSLSLITCSAEEFARNRIAAEGQARAHSVSHEPTLARIYAEVQLACGLTETQTSTLMKEEILLEARLIRPVPSAKSLIDAVRSSGRRVAFISEMYLPSVFLQEQLARHGLWQSGDECLVSCEHGKSKVTGDLFRELIRIENVPAHRVSHYGNDVESDVKAAQRAGLHVQLFPEGNLNRYEKILESHSRATEGLSSAMAGASRLARFATPASSPHDQALRDVAAGVMSPTLVGFVLWVLKRAQERKLKRLYFISRAGQILLNIARALAPQVGSMCDFRYLYGSRQSWHLPSITNIGEHQLHWLLDDTDFLSIRTLLARVAIDPPEIAGSLREFGFTETDSARNLTPRERTLFRSVFQDRTVRDRILQNAAQRRHLMRGYLKQEGLLDSKDWAMVDIGWKGRLQDSLTEVLGPEASGGPIGFYFGLFRGGPKEQTGVREAYLFDSRVRPGVVEAVPENIIALMEMFCAADHGMVTHYTEGADGFRPALKETHNRLAIEWGLPLIQQTTSAFANSLVLDGDLINAGADLRPATLELLRAFWLSPTFPEARAWGGYSYEDDQCGSYWDKLAESYQIKHIAGALVAGRMIDRHRASWRSGSWVLTPSWMRAALKAATVPGKLRRKLLSYRPQS